MKIRGFFPYMERIKFMDYNEDDNSTGDDQELSDFLARNLQILSQENVNSLFSHQCHIVPHTPKPYDDMITDPKVFESTH